MSRVANRRVCQRYTIEVTSGSVERVLKNASLRTRSDSAIFAGSEMRKVEPRKSLTPMLEKRVYPMGRAMDLRDLITWVVLVREAGLEPARLLKHRIKVLNTFLVIRGPSVHIVIYQSLIPLHYTAQRVI